MFKFKEENLIIPFVFILLIAVLTLFALTLYGMNKSSNTANVLSFEVNSQGEFFGELENGTKFSQTNIANDYTKLQKFQMGDVYWYISDKGVIEASSSLQALSIYLTK